MRRLFLCLFWILTLCFSTLSCAETYDGYNSDKLSIVVTVFPPYDFAREIAGDNAEISVLLPAGGDSHSFEPTPKDILSIKNCDLFIYVGGESDEYVRNILSSFDSPPKTIVMLECVNQLHSEDHEHEHSETDEHVWTSPDNCRKICSAITEKLCETDPENASEYRSGFERYDAELKALDDAFFSLSKEADTKTLIFGDRFPFLYFTERYGFEYYAAFPGCSSESEPSAATISQLIKKIKETNSAAVFYTESSSGNAASSIAEQTGAKAIMLHSCHNVTRAERDAGTTFLDLQKSNLSILREVLINGAD